MHNGVKYMKIESSNEHIINIANTDVVNLCVLSLQLCVVYGIRATVGCSTFTVSSAVCCSAVCQCFSPQNVKLVWNFLVFS